MLTRALAMIGAAVVALWILVALGLIDFRLCAADVGKCEAPNAASIRPAKGADEQPGAR